MVDMGVKIRHICMSKLRAIFFSMSSKKSFRNYTTADMENAIRAVKSGTSVASASKQFNIPRITLLYKSKGKYEVNCRVGPPTVLNSSEEDLLVKWLLTIADAGFPATRLQLLDSVQMLVRKLKRPNTFNNDRPGRKWFHCFLKRHPQITEKLTQNLTKSPSELTEQKIKSWFNEISDYINSKNLQEIFTDPRRVYNVDETAFFLAPKGIKCLMRKGDKTAYNFISNDDKECLTCLIGGNAAGAIVPPMVMFSYERIPPHISNLMPKGWAIGKSESGWMTGQTFYEFVANIFYPWLISNSIPLPIILFVDGHTSHLTMELSDFCVQVGIELIALYPNATHILQPMDVAVFHPLKCGWKKGVHKYKIENDGQKLKRDHFAPLLKSVIDEYISSETIKNGFKICGLFPLDPGAVPYQKYFKITAEKQISMKPQAFHTQQNLDFLEKELGEEKLRKFKEEQNEKWAGNIEDTSLYKLWKKIYDAVHVKLDENESPQNFIDDSEIDGGLDFTGETETQERSLGDISEPIFSNNMPSPNPLCQDNLGIAHTTSPKTVILDNTLLNPPINENNLCDLSIPSPFTSTLFWPKPAPTKTKKRCKEKILTVATSVQWRQYYVKKQMAKEKMKKENQERKIKSEEKKE